ncbi:hypothetical protein, partial [Alloscardovia omnicolens]|uniref:hypothetical protein n=1 Tax=Alloscardovia omnicolens TaxID=419015 RepID=UPI00254C6C87
LLSSQTTTTQTNQNPKPKRNQPHQAANKNNTPPHHTTQPTHPQPNKHNPSTACRTSLNASVNRLNRLWTHPAFFKFKD